MPLNANGNFHMSIWYKLALASGLAPLIAGVGIFAAWLVTRADWFMGAGIYNLMAGLVLFFCGLVFLLVYGQVERKSGKRFPQKQTVIGLAILLLNFPTSALIIYSVEYIVSTSSVTVVNNSSFAVTDMVLNAGLRSHPFPPIAADQEVTESFRFKYEGAIVYKLSVDGSVKSGIMFGYVSDGMGESATLVIKSDGTIQIRRANQ
jgi:uncharacterized membrane protein